MRIEILLSTWNGEKYLPALLDSLLGQEYGDFHITVRDDGSTDGTAGILAEYAERSPEKITVLPTGKKLGYPDCFWTLLEQAGGAEMYAFCDQDDVWDRQKLKCCAEMCAESAGEPILYVHDYRICDGELKPYAEHHLAEDGYDPGNPLMLEYYVMAPGFTMVLSEALRKRVIRDELQGRRIEHDRWLFWCGHFAGRIISDSRALVDYRRHGDTATQTGKSISPMLKEWWQEDIKGERMKRWSRTAQYFADCYGKEMEKQDEALEGKWRKAAGENGYVGRVFFKGRLKPTVAGEIALRACFLLNKK